MSTQHLLKSPRPPRPHHHNHNFFFFRFFFCLVNKTKVSDKEGDKNHNNTTANISNKGTRHVHTRRIGETHLLKSPRPPRPHHHNHNHHYHIHVQWAPHWLQHCKRTVALPPWRSLLWMVACLRRVVMTVPRNCGALLTVCALQPLLATTTG
ncbi:Hypothetical protein, putative [Bodo saltans]|uniref:Uncharacterized protein n=1 Tax=Bodo saltans TaxID=75058 RepID=A0A0S4ILZ8_BODSA|nr:Hypothetical protein, putative [Bodo saltans]|eukprot:CUE72185.1 Hypothetical protein, putative [Bodo saltans]